MTDEEKAALLVLGYSAHGWDTREPDSSYKLWSDLTDEEEAAAEVLGYDATTWDHSAGLAKGPNHVGKVWSELTDYEQAAMGIFGFTETLWGDGISGRPRSYFKRWDMLTICGKDISVTHIIMNVFRQLMAL